MCFKIILLGMKCDLRSDEAALRKMRDTEGEGVNPVSPDEGKELAKKMNAVEYFDTSAKANIGVEDSFNATVTAAFVKKENGACCILM